MITYPNLNLKLIERGISLADLAEIVGSDASTIESKLNGTLSWKLTEVVRVCLYLKDPDADHLFCPIRY